MSIDIRGINKAQVLAALFNASRPQGMGFLQHTPAPMTEAQAAELLEHGTDFDYVRGRVMKVDLSGDTLDERLYDRDNGTGAALAALKGLLQRTTA